jgi:hypothetical protein
VDPVKKIVFRQEIIKIFSYYVNIVGMRVQADYFYTFRREYLLLSYVFVFVYSDCDSEILSILPLSKDISFITSKVTIRN